MIKPTNPLAALTPRPAELTASDAGTHADGRPGAAPGGGAFGPPAAAGEVGTLGPYRVVRELGRGAMGAVYLAVDVRLNRELALKVMLPGFAADRDARERFLREARAAAAVAHDHVVTVYEADERDGVPYIATQLLQGCPLDQYLKHKGVPTVAQAVRIGYEAALGLAAAHAAGLIHRDVKPANLWLEAPHGRVKVLDFGLARPVGGAAEAELTRSGAVMGTPAYMSPEQARGARVDHRTDLFSLGAVLYRLLTGRNPFLGDSVMAVLMALGTEEPPPVRLLNPGVPEPLAALVHELLAKDPGGRPPTAGAVVDRLRALFAGPGEPPAPAAASPFDDLDATEADVPAAPFAAPVRSGRGVWIAVGVVVGMALAVAGGALALRGKGSGPQAAPAAAAAERAIPAPAERPPVKKSDPDRQAAEALKKYACVRLNLTSSGNVVETNPTDPLPTEPFTVRNVSFYLNQTFSKPLPPGLVKEVFLPAVAPLTSLTTVGDDYARAGFEPDDIARMAEMPFAAEMTHLPPCRYTPAVRDAHRKFPKLQAAVVLADAMDDDALEVLMMELPQGVKQLTLFRLGAKGAVGERGIAAVTGRSSLGWLIFKFSPAFDRPFAAAVARMPRVTNLTLDGIKQADDWLAELAACPKLTELIMQNCRVADADLTALSGMHRLNVVDLLGTQVTEAGVNALAAALPRCKIIWKGGTIEPKRK